MSLVLYDALEDFEDEENPEVEVPLYNVHSDELNLII